MTDGAGGGRVVAARGGMRMPALGMGTWDMGESRARRGEELAALRPPVITGESVRFSLEGGRLGQTDPAVEILTCE